VKLLAFVREETLGNAIGRCVRRALDNIAKDLPSWPLPRQVELLVPEKLRHRVKPDGRVPSPYIYNDRPNGIRLVSVPLSKEERITARIVAFGQLTSLAKWGAEVTENELRHLLSDGRELWKLPAQEQIELLLPKEPAAWEIASAVMASSGHKTREATRSLHRERGFDPGADFLLEKTG
jgi:hypothetical protein